MRTLEDWLSFRPSAQFLAQGHDLANELTHRERPPDESPDLVTTCQQLAAQAAQVLGRGPVDVPREFLSEVTQLLFVALDTAWADLDKQLGQTVVMISPFSQMDEDYEDLDIPEDLRSAVRAQHDEQATDAPAVLIFMDKNGEQTHPMVGDEVTIGRGPDNDIVLAEDVRVSRHHCRLVRRGSKYFIMDRDSANGTHVDGQFVVECQLSGGERIAIGDTVFGFRQYVRSSGR
ncbi:MAG: FHA domain-containing protein [Deltaproteobacteria bacterium]|nr:FHA domain-containing protein [Deltaproteobacteria bacterium]